MKVAKKLLRSSRKILLRHRQQPPTAGEHKRRDKHSPQPSRTVAAIGSSVHTKGGDPKLAKSQNTASERTSSSASHQNSAPMKNHQRSGTKKRAVNGRAVCTGPQQDLSEEDNDHDGSQNHAHLSQSTVKTRQRENDKLNGRERDAAKEPAPGEDEELEEENEEQDDEEEDEERVELNDAWIQGLMQQYWKVRRRYEEGIEADGAASLCRSCRNEPSDGRKYGVAVDGPPALSALHLNELPPTKNRQLAFLRNDHNHVVDRCPIISLESIAATPSMQYWTLTEVNVIAEDEYTLSHIPFLGDAEDDTDFCTDLIETFPDGIHGTKDGCGEYLNDWILYHMVKGLRAQMPHLETRIVFECVYDRFPNKASVQDLISMYPDLQIRFEPETIDKLELTNEWGELVANFSASRLLNSYEVLLCHKCYSYDCVMHNATINDGYGKEKARRASHSSWRENGEERRPCSRHCYLHSPAKRAAPDSSRTNAVDRKTKLAGSKQDISCPLAIDLGRHGQLSSSGKAGNAQQQGRQRATATWTPHEEAIFNMLITTGEERYCRIAKILGMCCAEEKKTCREVFEYASRTAPLSPRLEMLASPGKNAKKKNDSHRTFRAVKWANTNGKVENCCMYKPCNHEGSCKKEHGCRCVSVENLCTKYCPCGEDCPNRFPGCRCAPGNCRTRQCQCYFASWECDPDICKSCNCDKFDGCGEPICKNVSIQRGLQKRLLVAPSQVAGWGCFAQEDIEKNEFISEYCGEVISQGESERRGKIYDKIKCSYLFGLNDEQVVDATRVGNVIRFANHSRNPNCRAKVIVVNGDHKIGIFANKRIARGEELFFDYAYNKSQQIAFLSKELPRHYQ